MKSLKINLQCECGNHVLIENQVSPFGESEIPSKSFLIFAYDDGEVAIKCDECSAIHTFY